MWWLHSYPLNRKSSQRGWSIKERERNNPFSLLMGAKCYLEIFWYLFSLQNVTIHGLLRGVCQDSQSRAGMCCSGCPWTAKSHSRVEEGPPDGGMLLNLGLYRKLKQSNSGISSHLASHGGDKWLLVIWPWEGSQWVHSSYAVKENAAGIITKGAVSQKLLLLRTCWALSWTDVKPATV